MRSLIIGVALTSFWAMLLACSDDKAPSAPEPEPTEIEFRIVAPANGDTVTTIFDATVAFPVDWPVSFVNIVNVGKERVSWRTEQYDSRTPGRVDLVVSEAQATDTLPISAEIHMIDGEIRYSPVVTVANTRPNWAHSHVQIHRPIDSGLVDDTFSVEVFVSLDTLKYFASHVELSCDRCAHSRYLIPVDSNFTGLIRFDSCIVGDFPYLVSLRLVPRVLLSSAPVRGLPAGDTTLLWND